VVVEVLRCAYCIPAGSTLQNLARHEFRNVDWLRLYNSNPLLAAPDTVIPEEYIKLGPVYTVQPGDSLISIAASAKTTVKTILENNADLMDHDSLVEGQGLCLLLCSSANAPQYTFGAP